MYYSVRRSVKIMFVAMLVFVLSSSALASDNNAPVRLGIMKFSNYAFDVPDQAVASIGNLFASALFKYKTIRVIERERLEEVSKELGLGASGLVDEDLASKIGKVAGCKYLLLGAITNLANSKETQGLIGIAASTKYKVKAELNVRVIDVETSAVVYAGEATGNASTKDESFSIYGIEAAKEGFSGLEGQAIKDAVNQLTPQIEAAIVEKENPALAGGETDDAFKALVSETKTTPKASATKSKATTTKTTTAPTPAPTTTTAPAPVKEPEKNTKASVTNLSSSSTPKAKAKNNYENKSTDFEKVINSYGIEEGMTRALILRHRDANKKNGNKAKLDAYSEIFNLYNGDYLAAYNAALAEFDMGHGSRARDWCQKALDINPRYLPALQLMKRAKGL